MNAFRQWRGWCHGWSWLLKVTSWCVAFALRLRHEWRSLTGFVVPDLRLPGRREQRGLLGLQGLQGLQGLRIGTDLVYVPDVVESVAQFGQRYLQRVFTQEELRYCTSASPVEDAGEAAFPVALRYASLAGRFAAKEAVMKLLRPDQDTVLLWTSIEVLRSAHGAPDIRLSGHAAVLARLAGFSRIEVSLTHTGDYASATALAIG